jgi:formate hydrogenlyase transcriptional activator
MFVQPSVLSPARLKSGALYTSPRYSARSDQCLARTWPGNIRELENFIERAVIITRGKSLEAPLRELERTNTIEFPHAKPPEVEQVVGERTDLPIDKTTVADGYERKQRDGIIRALTTCKGRVGGSDGAAARLGMNRTTLLSRMKKFGLYAKQYA